MSSTIRLVQKLGERPRLQWILVFAAGVALRIGLFSGYGLGDDPNYFPCYERISRLGTYDPADPYAMRFGIWIPVVLCMKLLGPTEAGFVGAITFCSVVNLALIYLLARQEWEPPYALLAMALIAVFPLDVLCSTLFANDIILATYCFAGLWLYRAALAGGGAGGVRAVAAVASGVLLFFGFVTKPWVVLVAPLFLWEGARHWRTARRYSLQAAGATVVLVGSYLAWQWARFGDPLYHVSVSRKHALFVAYNRDSLLDYPRMLLLRNEYGSYFAGFYPHAVVLLAAAFAFRAKKAGKWVAFSLAMLLGLAAMPSHREGGHWVTLTPHIFRYLTLLSIPLCLALAAYVRELLLWSAPVGRIVAALLLITSAVDAIALTAPTRDAFGEERRALAVLRQFPGEPVWADSHLISRFIDLELDDTRYGQAHALLAETPAARALKFAAVTRGLVVTGGGRLPWYGCFPCIADVQGVEVPPSWSLVTEFAGRPLTLYRHEPLRVWRVAGRAAVTAAPDAKDHP